MAIALRKTIHPNRKTGVSWMADRTQFRKVKENVRENVCGVPTKK